jgi:thiamine-phosphate pyrophosphorylase
MLAPYSCQTWRVVDRIQRLAKSRLYLVCGERPDRFLEAALGGGVDIVQLRCKDAADEQILLTAARYARVCAAHGALFILNDRPDLAAQAGADGVHVGQDDMPVAQARAIIGHERLIGLSTHSPAQVNRAAELDVDYIGVGPVHETPTKPGRPAVGLELVRYAAEHAPVPFFAIGGIAPGNIVAVVAAGAQRVAVVRALTDASDPERIAEQLRRTVLDGAAAGERASEGDAATSDPLPAGERVGPA